MRSRRELCNPAGSACPDCNWIPCFARRQQRRPVAGMAGDSHKAAHSILRFSEGCKQHPKMMVTNLHMWWDEHVLQDARGTSHTTHHACKGGTHAKPLLLLLRGTRRGGAPCCAVCLPLPLKQVRAKPYTANPTPETYLG